MQALQGLQRWEEAADLSLRAAQVLPGGEEADAAELAAAQLYLQAVQHSLGSSTAAGSTDNATDSAAVQLQQAVGLANALTASSSSSDEVSRQCCEVLISAGRLYARSGDKGRAEGVARAALQLAEGRGLVRMQEEVRELMSELSGSSSS
mmetsp:Transcript_16872/g.36524  ORF Transcript_16872/g.36524 Transcript_16872/m.36524 type:complete len:150 (-) Transcript_16872:460-909(-)